MADRSKCPLSSRELEVLRLVAEGATNQEIARHLSISANTVKTHLRNIFDKLEVVSRTEAVTYAIRHGWLSIPGQQPAPSKVVPPISTRPTPLGWRTRLYFLLPLFLLAALWAWQWQRNQSPATTPQWFCSNGQASGPAPERSPIDRWQALAPMPRPRSRMAAGTWQGKFVLVGGENEQGNVAPVDIYDPQRRIWGRGRAQPDPASNVQAAVVSNRLFVPGGTLANGQITNRLAIYNLEQDQWQNGAPLPHSLAGYALALYRDKIYLLGGWDGNSIQDRIYRYDIGNGTWSLVGNLPYPSLFAAAAADEQCIYLAGGWDGQQARTDVHCYHPETGQWETLPPLQWPRQGAAALLQDNALYVIGGQKEGVPFGERLDLLSGTWAKIVLPYSAGWRHLALLSDGWNLYALGGWAGAYLAVNERYQSSFRNFIPFGPVREGTGGKNSNP